MDEIDKKVNVEKASTGRRFVSCLIDGIIVGIISGILSAVGVMTGGISSAGKIMASGWVVIIISNIIIIAYYTILFGRGQTVGMMAMKIKLIRTNGTYPIGYLRGFLRFLGMYVSGLILYIGYLWIVIDKNKQGWHDKIADTYVVPV